jgi:hypothetical protein
VSRRRPIVAAGATVIGIAAALGAGYVAAGAAGLIDVAALATLGVLTVARGVLRGEKPRPVRLKKPRPDAERRPAVRAADFPAYTAIASDVEWSRLARRHYEHGLRPRLARLAAALGRPEPPHATGQADADGPGPDLATLDRIVTRLEGR